MANDAFMKPEVPDSFRDLMKVSIEQAKRAFDTFAATSEKTWKTFETKVTLNGQPLSPNPHSVAPTMWGGQHQEADFTIEAAPGTYTLVATIDATGQQPEYHYASNQGGGSAEGDNTASKKITVPGGC